MQKTILITGTSSGFGRAAVHYFAEHGWNVVATMRNTAQADSFAAHPSVVIEYLDVEDTGSIRQAVARAIDRFGQIDVLINNAGFGLQGLFETTPPEKVAKQFAVNVFGVMDVIREALPHMRERRSGTIINVSSGAGVFGLPALSLYTASKFALEGFSESLAYELAPLGITIKLVEPGGVLDTGFVSRAASEANTSVAIADYLPIERQIAEVYQRLRAERATATSRDVAAVLFEAATDGTDQLRYIATPDIEPLIRLRRESGEAQYMRAMKTQFGLG